MPINLIQVVCNWTVEDRTLSSFNPLRITLFWYNSLCRCYNELLKNLMQTKLSALFTSYADFPVTVLSSNSLRVVVDECVSAFVPPLKLQICNELAHFWADFFGLVIQVFANPKLPVSLSIECAGLTWSGMSVGSNFSVLVPPLYHPSWQSKSQNENFLYLIQ